MADGNEGASWATRLRRQLESGNDNVPPGSLPEETKLRERMEAYFDSASGGTAGLPSSLRKDVDDVLNHLYRGTPASPLLRGTLACEAVVVPDGSRPVFFLEADRLTRKGPENGPFVTAVEKRQADLEQVALAVGRVETDDKLPPAGMDKWYEGSAFMIADNLAMTNRHVMERLVNEAENPAPPFTLKATYWLNFTAELGSTTGRRFKIERVAYAGPQVIGDGGDLTRLDVALLEIGQPEVSGTMLPTPLQLSARRLKTFQAIAVIGYPAAPPLFDGTGDPPEGYELEEILRQLFDARFGYKRCAAGEVEAMAGSYPEDTRRWAIKHDASTLTGNSGSPIVRLDDGPLQAAALHFRGIPRQANFGHVFDVLRADFQQVGVQLED